MTDGSRNMIGIGVATATAGIVVGAITLTGLALRMTEFVEFVSRGNVVVMLLFIAFVCLLLGLGVPTTANYVLVATLMAPVVVELGAQAGLVIPLIAVHLFVFYYGIIGDITPPVGLATFAAAAISGEDAIATGIQGAIYAMRTVILPFIWIFNPALLLIDIDSVAELVLVVVASMAAMLIFAAITMYWFRIRMRLWEAVVLALACVLLFRPDMFMDWLAPEYTYLPPAKLYDVARDLPANARLVLVIKGTTIEGDDVRKTVAVRLGAAGDDGRKRLADAGLTFSALGDTLKISGVKFGTRAKKAGIDQGYDVASVAVPSGRASPYWFYLPAFALIGLVWWSQGRRMALPRRAGARLVGPPLRCRDRADPRARAFGRAGQRRARARVARGRAHEPARRQPVGGPRARRRPRRADDRALPRARRLRVRDRRGGDPLHVLGIRTVHRRRCAALAAASGAQAQRSDDRRGGGARAPRTRAHRAGRHVRPDARDDARRVSRRPDGAPVMAEGALAALDAGDGARHDALVAQAVSRASPDADVVALAQFSLARAAGAVTRVVGVPVLATPASAVRVLRARLERG
jgi:hypothetical protein